MSVCVITVLTQYISTEHTAQLDPTSQQYAEPLSLTTTTRVGRNSYHDKKDAFISEFIRYDYNPSRTFKEAPLQLLHSAVQ
jgi:hypothetical protein